MKRCIICGAPIHYHHLYCEEHYPHKTAEIKRLNKELNKYRRIISNILNPGVNKNKYVTKKQLLTWLKRYKVEGYKDE